MWSCWFVSGLSCVVEKRSSAPKTFFQHNKTQPKQVVTLNPHYTYSDILPSILRLERAFRLEIQHAYALLDQTTHDMQCSSGKAKATDPRTCSVAELADVLAAAARSGFASAVPPAGTPPPESDVGRFLHVAAQLREASLRLENAQAMERDADLVSASQLQQRVRLGVPKSPPHLAPRSQPGTNSIPNTYK